MNQFQNIILSVILLLSFGHSNAQTGEIIDNNKLIELRKLNIDDELVISFIQTSTTNFDCSMAGILKLKKDSISNKVIAEVKKYCDLKKSNTFDSVNTNNPLTPHQSGIYLFDNNELKKVYPAAITQEKSGGMGSQVLSKVTFGLKKNARKAALDGPMANLKGGLSSIFYFYFDASTSKDASLSNWWFTKAISPNEFALIKLMVGDKKREYKIGKSDSYTYQSGIDNDQKVFFDIEEPKPGIFKVTTKKPLESGEYCFLYSATIPEHYTNDRVFDFSIK